MTCGRGARGSGLGVGRVRVAGIGFGFVTEDGNVLEDGWEAPGGGGGVLGGCVYHFSRVGKAGKFCLQADGGRGKRTAKNAFCQKPQTDSSSSCASVQISTPPFYRNLNQNESNPHTRPHNLHHNPLIHPPTIPQPSIHPPIRHRNPRNRQIMVSRLCYWLATYRHIHILQKGGHNIIDWLNNNS